MDSVGDITKWIFFIVSISCCNARTSIEDFVPPSENKIVGPCPEPSDILPCSCFEEGHFINMDCSNVTSEEELRRVFDQSLPNEHFNEFIMAGNQNITFLNEGIFGQATFMAISITDGVLSEIRPNTFANSFSTLWQIVIESNPLYVFPFEEISQYTNLEDLFLKKTNITSPPKIESQSLLSITLGYNPIQPEAFQGVTLLSVFNCEECELTEVLPDAFSGLEYFRYVSLEHNKLTSIAEGTFRLNSDYSSLRLTGNQLKDVAVGAITGVTDLFHIRFNQLEEYYEDVWRPIMENVTYFSFSYNPLSCGCDIAWLILDPVLMEKVDFDAKCADGILLLDLDPAYYEEMC